MSNLCHFSEWTQVLNFIIENKTEKNCSHVLFAWIKYGNDFEMITAYVIEWLKCNFFEELDSCFVISTTLQTEKGFKVVYKYAIKWLDNFGYSYNAKFPLSSWLKYSGNEGAGEISKWIVFWVENFYDYAPSKRNWRDDLLLKYTQWLSTDKNLNSRDLY